MEGAESPVPRFTRESQGQMTPTGVR